MTRMVGAQRTTHALCLLVLDDGEPDWVLKHARDERRKAIFEKKCDVEDRLRRVRMEELRQEQRHANREGQPKKLVCGETR
jgi:chromosome transmission fidelity protein 1